MSQLIFQKYLDWVHRFFYQSSGGVIPPVQLTLDVSQDWPLETDLRLIADYVTIAGTVTTTIYAPGLDRHGLVYLASISDVAVAIAATDQIGLFLRSPNGDGVRPWEITGTGIAVGTMLSLIGGNRIIAGVQIQGAPPVYVAAGQELRIIHTSVAGGATVRPRVWVVDRSSYHPLRLP